MEQRRRSVIPSPIFLKEGYWRRYRRFYWTGLGIVFFVVLPLLGYAVMLQDGKRSGINGNRTVRQKGRRKAAPDRIPNKFPRVSLIHTTLTDIDSDILKLTTAAGETTITFWTPSLRKATSSMKHLERKPEIQSTKISRSKPSDGSGYKMDVKIRWKKKR